MFLNMNPGIVEKLSIDISCDIIDNSQQFQLYYEQN